MTIERKLTVDELLKLIKNDEGELPSGINGVNIKYNALTGEVKLREVDKKERINNIFSGPAFEVYRFHVRAAIGWVAKLHLLDVLSNLNESLRNLIDKNHQIDFATGQIQIRVSTGIEKKLLSEAQLDKILGKVLYDTAPHESMRFFGHAMTGTSPEALKIQNAVHEVLVKLNGFDNIKTKEDAYSIIKDIKTMYEPSLEVIRKSNK